MYRHCIFFQQANLFLNTSEIYNCTLQIRALPQALNPTWFLYLEFQVYIIRVNQAEDQETKDNEMNQVSNFISRDFCCRILRFPVQGNYTTCIASNPLGIHILIRFDKFPQMIDRKLCAKSYKKKKYHFLCQEVS